MKLAGALGTLLILVTASCNYSTQKNEGKLSPTEIPSDGVVADVAWLMENLFLQSCASCHNSGRQPGGFKFESSSDLMSTTRTGGIRPGAATESQIFQAISSGRMPPGSYKPSGEALAVLSCWIDAGAREDSTVCAPQKTSDAQPQPPQNPPGQDFPSIPGQGESPDPTDDSVLPVQITYLSIASILQANCTNCHGASPYGAGDVSLTTLDSILRPATGPQLVACGDASASSLYDVLVDDFMPMGSEPLSAAEKKVIADWINGGCTP